MLTTDPVVLVLGQSKGRNQWKPNDHDFAVAFDGLRGRLRKILERVGLVIEAQDFDACFRGTERYFGFASLVRFSFSWSDGRSTDSPVTSAMRSSVADIWVRTCIGGCPGARGTSVAAR